MDTDFLDNYVNYIRVYPWKSVSHF